MANTKGLQGTGGVPPGSNKIQRPPRSNQPKAPSQGGTQGTGGKIGGGKSMLTG